MPSSERLKGLAAKIEATYNTDPTVAEATDSIQTHDLTVDPLDGELITRGIDSAQMGAESQIVVASRLKTTFGVECAGSGVAGTAPEYGELLRACGLAESLTALVDAQYDPVSSGYESIWMEPNMAGTQHQGAGSRGTLSIAMAARQVPKMSFDMTSLYVAPTAVALPSYTLSGFQTPEVFNNQNTVIATLHTEAIELESFSIDYGNQLEHIDVPNFEQILIVGRQVRGQITFQAPALGTKDWFAAARALATGTLVIQHGDTAGNIFQIDGTNVEVSNPKYSSSRGQLMISLDLTFLKNTPAGNDEIKLTIK